ncbi:hypothetical protein BGAL_0716g00030 [Botrytis galanthina]|uniref:Uncharacterized protein n=1 Tax=Botrytis galanthina TaxID=278940 RepID=A0A4S8QHH9_9HELO|nr:hypothetical protein BGAL_0716g00030 [Botrytis galanthina]
MWDRLRQIVRRTSGDSRRRSRRREETEREIVGDSRGRNVGETRETRETRGGTTGRAIGEALRANREQASRVGHIGQHEYRYRGPAPSNSHTQSISSSNSNWSTPRSRHPLFQNHPTSPYYGPPTPPYSPPPPPYSPPPNYGTPCETSSLFEHGRRSTSSRSGSDSLVSRNQHNTAMVRHEDTDSRRQTAADQSMLQAFVPIHQEKPFFLLVHPTKEGLVLFVHQQGVKIIVILMDHRRDPILHLQEIVKVSIRPIDILLKWQEMFRGVLGA